VLSPDEDRTYRMLYDGVKDELRAPDLMIYLRCSVRTLRRRIRARGRAMEKQLPPKYLRALHDLYEAWFENYTLSETVVFETDRLDPVTDIVDCHQVMEVIERYL
ncbi:MAG: deoxynucleoside kinase, partial [Phycisphaerales bacterium]|nr:deoxynucleoside kinase [Phycisphaerales bacterium]